MIRPPAQEELHRLMVKTLDQVFTMRAKESLGCSQIEAQVSPLGTSTQMSRGYGTTMRSTGQVTNLCGEDAYRSSDRDPVIVGLELWAELPY